MADEWVRLTDGRQYSRLLYPNPVCLLCTWNDEPLLEVSAAVSTEDPSACRYDNVMVLSWLTATNNEGTFMFSINRKRFTASRMKQSSHFVLAVPVQGMEELVRNVGSVSGQRRSKFPSDHSHRNKTDQDNAAADSDYAQLSKRQRKKMDRFVHGIPNLRKVGLGTAQLYNELNSGSPFAIAGTVAHLYCAVYSILDDTIDSEHRLVLARIEDAYVKASYWQSDKNLFYPSKGGDNDDDHNRLPSILTFFGSQRFGSIHEI